MICDGNPSETQRYNYLKHIKQRILIISLFINGVVSDVSVSLYEGDSVSLHTNTKIQRDNLIEWRFGDQQDLIARINGEATTLKIYDNVLDGRFKDKLQVNTENGDLTITNITTNNNTGDYMLEISNRAITRETFIINVSADKVKTEMMGDSVITVKNVIKKPGDEKMMWRIRHNNTLVAEMNDMVLTYNANNGRFRDRLQVNDQTGDLIITNIRPDDSGSYDVDITVGSHIYTIHRSFNVNVKDQPFGLSSGVIAGICVGVVLGVVAAAAVGFIIYRKSFKANGNEREGVGPSINYEATGEESTEMIRPLRTGDPSSSDVP